MLILGNSSIEKIEKKNCYKEHKSKVIADLKVHFRKGRNLKFSANLWNINLDSCRKKREVNQKNALVIEFL